MATDTAASSSPDIKLLKLSNPVFAYLEITYDCPGSCPGCAAVTNGKRPEAMPGERWIKIIREISKLCEEVRLTGGEPTGHPDFLKIIEACDRNKLPFKIYTNGHWPDTDRLLKLLSTMPYFRGFRFSLHGSTAEIHEYFSGLSNFNTVISNMEKAARMGFSVYTSTVLGEFNQHNIAEILKLVASSGSRRHYFQRYIGPYRQGISLFRENLYALLMGFRRIAPGIYAYRTGECFPRCFYPDGSACLAGITHITITPTGLIKACPFSSEILGSWKSGEKNNINGKGQLQAWAGDFNPDCLACNEIELCMGGCRAIRRNFNFKSDPLMEVPIINSMTPEQESNVSPVTLYGNLKSVCAARREKFGYLLIHEGEVIPITEKAHHLLQFCDGTKGIGEVNEMLGAAAMAFLISLYQRGFLELV